MIKRWLKKWLGVEVADANIEFLSRSVNFQRDEIERLQCDALLPANFHAHNLHIENSLRLIEGRLKLIEGLELADGTVGEHAARKAAIEHDARQARLDESAAKVRGMTMDEYKADVARRKAEKAEKSARETIEGEAT